MNPSNCCIRKARKLIFFSIITVSCLISCATETGQVISAYQKETIIKEIEEIRTLSTGGLEESNGDQALSIFSKSNETKYIRNGHHYPDIETAQNQYAGWVTAPGALQKKMTCDPVYYDILDGNTVAMTTLGSRVNTGETITDQQPCMLACTMVWRKEVDGWNVINMYNSRNKLNRKLFLTSRISIYSRLHIHSTVVLHNKMRNDKSLRATVARLYRGIVGEGIMDGLFMCPQINSIL